VGKALLADIERIVHGYIARLRSDPELPGARALEEALLQDHLVTFLADLASTLASMDLSAGWTDESVRDGTAIQRVVGVRHGAQRARLGWSEAEVRREFVILREELTAALQRRGKHELRGPTGPRTKEIERGAELLGHFVTVLETISLSAYAEASAESLRQVDPGGEG
jgi:hypothetical protein